MRGFSSARTISRPRLVWSAAPLMTLEFVSPAGRRDLVSTPLGAALRTTLDHARVAPVHLVLGAGDRAAGKRPE